MSRLLIFIVSLLLLSSCGSGSDTFRLEGRLRKIRQSEFFIYSLDGGMEGRDTIKVRDGRFEYETMISGERTLVLVFPNFSEQPIFAKAGAKVTISGDASQLKAMDIEGTDDNEMYTEFRHAVAEKDEEKVKETAVAFINNNPKSPVSRYLIDKYFIKTSHPDIRKALALLNGMLEDDPQNARLMMMKTQLESVNILVTGDTIPTFTTISITGDTITKDSLLAEVNVVNVWASWRTASTTTQNSLRALKKEYGDSLSVMSICLDADSSKCAKTIGNNKGKLIDVCDGKMWNSPLIRTFGFATAESNLISDKNGKVIAVNLDDKSLIDKIKSLMKQK